MVLNHELIEAKELSPTYGEYICQCGFKGITDMARHLVGIFSITDRLKKNHELHATRAYIRQLKA